MKGSLGIIVAVFLGLVALALNWYYLFSKTRDIDTVQFIGIKKPVSAGEVLSEDHFEPVPIPATRNVDRLREYAYLYEDANNPGAVTREIQVECLPTDIPEHIDVDVTELMLHQSIRLRDLAQDPKWKPVTDGDTMLVHVVMPKAEESATAAAADAAAPAAAAEPEVIKKGKTEEKEEEKGKK